MRTPVSIILAVILAACSNLDSNDAGTATDEIAQPQVAASSVIEAGRYLVYVGGCNDCHTEGFLATEGDVPEEEWLRGSAVGWRGPWGTSYAKNLRLTASTLTEEEFVALLHSGGGLPPMPWMNTVHISDADAGAIYHYIRSLGDVGEAAPAPVPPDQEPATPFILLVPVEPQ